MGEPGLKRALKVWGGMAIALIVIAAIGPAETDSETTKAIAHLSFIVLMLALAFSRASPTAESGGHFEWFHQRARPVLVIVLRIGASLAALYFLVRFVKWAWTD